MLCALEGRTTESAARTLGCPRGTVATRLARARALLRRRLARRGFDPATPSVFGNVVAALPAALVDATVHAARFGTADRAAAAGVISARVAALTKGALPTMSLTKLTLTTAVVLTLGLLGALLAHRAAAVEPAQMQSAPAAPPEAPEEKAPAVVFQWKFEKDKPFYQEVTTTTTQEHTVKGNKVNQSQVQTFYLGWTPLKEECDNWTLKEKCLGVKMDLDVGGNKIQFDSTKEVKADNRLGDFYKSLTGLEFQVTLDKEGRPTKVEGREEFLNKVAAADQALTRQIMSEAALRQLAEACFAGPPGHAVRPGDTWTRKSVLEVGSLASYCCTYTYSYKGKEGKFDRIEVESTLTVLPAAEGGGALPFKFKQGKGNSGGAGVILFDRARGRIDSLESTLNIEGVLTPRTGDADGEVLVSQKQKITLKTTDANPLTPARTRDDAEEIQRLREENERLRRQLKAVQDALRGADKLKE